jgi:putative redox protein
MTDQSGAGPATAGSERHIEISRVRKARFVARNSRGGELEFGEASDEAFTPVELLLIALAGCTAIDVDYITAKRAEAETFRVQASAEKVRDEHGNRLVDVLLQLGVTFPEGAGGDAARDILPSAVQRSHDRLCTVSRTVEVGTPVRVEVGEARLAEASGDDPEAGGRH